MMNERYKCVFDIDYNFVESVILNNRVKSWKIIKIRGDEKIRCIVIFYDRGVLKNFYEVFFIKIFLLNNRKYK